MCETQCVDQPAAAAGEKNISECPDLSFQTDQTRAVRSSGQIRARCLWVTCTWHSITHRAAVITQAIMAFGLWFTYLIYHSNPMENELAYLSCQEGKD